MPEFFLMSVMDIPNTRRVKHTPQHMEMNQGNLAKGFYGTPYFAIAFID